jgi:hypothetical protein
VQPSQGGRIPPHHQAHAADKGELRQARGRAAQPIPDRDLTPNDRNRIDRISLRAKRVHVNRVPTRNVLALTNPAQAKRVLERTNAKKQENAKRVMQLSNLTGNNRILKF